MFPNSQIRRGALSNKRVSGRIEPLRWTHFNVQEGVEKELIGDDLELDADESGSRNSRTVSIPSTTLPKHGSASSVKLLLWPPGP